MARYIAIILCLVAIASPALAKIGPITRVAPIGRPTILLSIGDICGGVAWCSSINKLSLCRNTTLPWSDVACVYPFQCRSIVKNNTTWICVAN